IILLDEPTTYLDMTHQIEILDLLFELNETEKRAIVMVLHDLNLAGRYAHHIVAIKNKQIYGQDIPDDVVNSSLVDDVYGSTCETTVGPLFGTPLCMPHGKRRRINVKKPKTRKKETQIWNKHTFSKQISITIKSMNNTSWA